MGKLYALLVGINEYALKPGENNIDLSGCLHDVELFRSYLEEKLPAAERQIFEPLLDQKATKTAVVEGIRNQLGEAGSEDTALFYFSGHGCREQSSETIQPFIIGDKIEALVCHDSFAGGTTTTLADLEIRYLFHQLAAQANPPGRIIIITDSCNSGGVTRSMFNLKPRLGPVAGLRNWNQFIFHEHIKEEQLKQSTSLNELFPKAAHLHLAACESKQSAFEATGQFGVFTSNMVEVLKNTGGRVTFRDLHSRVKYLVRRKFKEQTPQIYSYDPARDWSPGAGPPPESVPDDLMDTELLKGVSAESKLKANIHYFNYKWVLDKGAIHGMPPLDVAKKKINIRIIESVAGEEKLLLEQAQILGVDPATTRLGGVTSKLDRKHPERYSAEIAGLYLDPLNIQILGDKEIIAQLSEPDSEYAAQLAERNIQLLEENDPVSPDYKIITATKSYLLTTARDSNDPALARQLCREILRFSRNTLPELVHYLSRISRWQFALGMHNAQPKTDLQTQVKWELAWTPATRRLGDTSFDRERHLDLDTHRAGQSVEDPMNYPAIDLELPLPEAAGHTSYFYFRIRIQNESPDPVYVSLLYLGQLFEIYSKNFKEYSNVVRLDGATETGSGNSAWAFGTTKQGIPFKLSSFIRQNNWEEETFFLKLIISNMEYELGDTFDQSGLPPPGPRTRGSDEVEQYRSAAQPDLPDWTSKMVEIRVKNPNYKPIA